MSRKPPKKSDMGKSWMKPVVVTVWVTVWF